MGSPLLIYEIGQNHNGQLGDAVALVDKISDTQADAVKVCIRDLKHELSPELAMSEYDSVNAFDVTYGGHRAKLELTRDEYGLLENYTRSIGLKFVASFTNPGVLEWVNPDIYKVASRDMQNYPLLEAMAKRACERDKPIMISTGMAASLRDIYKAVKFLMGFIEPAKIYIMACVSSYPTPDAEADIMRVKTLKDYFPGHVIGYSDHTVGIKGGPLAVALGATVVERHVTLDRMQKGSDHLGALGPEGMFKYARDVKATVKMLGNGEFKLTPSIAEKAMRIGRSLAVKKDLPKGHVLKESDLIMVSPGTGYPWSKKDDFIGKPLKKDIKKNQLLEK